MQLTEHTPGNYYFIQSIGPDHVTIQDTTYHHSLLVGAHLLETSWNPPTMEALTAGDLDTLFKYQPEVIVLGQGVTQCFPDPAIFHLCHSRGIGLECMTLEAACRTFNVLMSENRRALLAILFPHDQ